VEAIDRRAFLVGTVATAVADPLTVAELPSGPNFFLNPVTLDDFTVLRQGVVRLSPRAVRWAEIQAENWGITPNEVARLFAVSVDKGTWPYEYKTRFGVPHDYES
jgi:hypothetical protein